MQPDEKKAREIQARKFLEFASTLLRASSVNIDGAFLVEDDVGYQAKFFIPKGAHCLSQIGRAQRVMRAFRTGYPHHAMVKGDQPRLIFRLSSRRPGEAGI